MNHINTINNNKSINSVQRLEQYKTNIMNKYRSEHSEHVAKHYFLHKELTEEEYNQCINNLEECLLHPPEKYNTTELIKAYKDSVQHEILLIKRDQEQTRNFNIFLSEKEEELNQYPTNNSKQVQTMSTNRRIREKDEEEEAPKKGNQQAQEEFQDGLVKSEELLEEDEIEEFHIEDLENPNKDFYVKLNSKNDIIELYDSATDRLIETISGNELQELVNKLNMASGIFINKKV